MMIEVIISDWALRPFYALISFNPKTVLREIGTVVIILTGRDNETQKI